MILRRLRIRRFKKFQDTTFAFVPGLNIIQGPNESGKTTVMEAVFAALLVNPAQPQAGFADLTRPWGEQRLGELVLEFQVDDGSYLLRKDFEAGTALLQPQERKGVVDNLRDIQQQILDWMGLPSEAAVRSTAYVGQGELARLTDERHLIGARLSKILSGGGAENVDAALRWIDERSQHPEPAAGKPSGAGDGRLQELVSQQQELERKEERARTLWSELRAATRQLEELERQIAMRTEQLQAAEQQAGLQRRLEDLEKELREQQDLLNRLEKHLNRLNSLETRLKSFTDQNQAALQALVAARRTAQNLGHALQTGRQQLEREEATLEQLGSGHQHARRRAGAGLVVSLLGAMAITLGFVLPQLRWSVPGWGTIAAGALLMVLGVQMRGRVGETQALYRRQEQRVLDLRKKVEAAHAQMEEAEKELRAKLASLGAESVEAVEQRFASYMDVARQQEEARLAVQQLLGGRTREKVVERMQEVEREVAEVRGRLHDVTASARATEATRDRLQRESQALQKEAAALGERKARIEGMLEGLLDRPEGRESIEERIAALRQRQARAAEMAEVLAFTRRMLEEARKQSFFPARALLERRAGEFLKVATRNGYQKVALEERTLTPRVWVEAARGWKGPASLSQGTVDQLYLALRLALLEVICQGRTPPLFLDEPFVYFDPQRVKGVLNLLTTAARERQVLLFTSWPREDLSADQVITLSAGSPAAPAEPR